MTVDPQALLPATGAGTLDAILACHAVRDGGALALVDPPDRELVMDGAPRRLSFAEAERAVAALAALLRGLGLPTGAVIGIHLPNTVEAVISLLAVSRAGMVAAPLPLLWRQAEATKALSSAGARALIAGGAGAGATHAELAMHFAADSFNVRFVCAFGASLPDDVVPLDGIFDPDPDPDPAAAEPEADTPASHHPHRPPSGPQDVAIITFDIGRDGPLAVPHTHAELMAAGLAVLLETALPPRSRILSTMMGSSFAVIATSVVPWLVNRGTLVLHQPFDAAQLAAQFAEDGCGLLVAPGPLAAGLAAAAETRPQRIAAIWRSAERQSAASPARTGMVDILAFREFAMAALGRDAAGRPRQFGRGPLRSPSNSAEGMVMITVDIGPDGTLLVGGPMTPARLHPIAAEEGVPDGFIDTGIPCRLDPQTGLLAAGGNIPGIIGIGGYPFAIADLQDMVGRVAPDSVLAVLPDMLAGAKLAGFAVDVMAMRDELVRRGINPLVVEAFRERSAMSQSPAA